MELRVAIDHTVALRIVELDSSVGAAKTEPSRSRVVRVEGDGFAQQPIPLLHREVRRAWKLVRSPFRRSGLCSSLAYAPGWASSASSKSSAMTCDPQRRLHTEGKTREPRSTGDSEGPVPRRVRAVFVLPTRRSNRLRQIGISDVLGSWARVTPRRTTVQAKWVSGWNTAPRPARRSGRPRSRAASGRPSCSRRRGGGRAHEHDRHWAREVATLTRLAVEREADARAGRPRRSSSPSRRRRPAPPAPGTCRRCRRERRRGRAGGACAPARCRARRRGSRPCSSARTTPFSSVNGVPRGAPIAAATASASSHEDWLRPACSTAARAEPVAGGERAPRAHRRAGASRPS